jgi:SNF2 family DNA or RNA helicase
VIGVECALIRGGVSESQRQNIMKDFNEAKGFAAIAFQIETGGHGLNLHAASVVVIMEPQYKPSIEWQAMGRAHRMGQTNPVVVRRLVARDSTDSNIVRLSGFKAELFDQLARPSVLADASPAARICDIDPGELLREEQRRIGSPVTADERR